MKNLTLIPLKFWIVQEGGSTSEEALRGGLKLQKLFAFICTNFLLSSCSLVNKFWNTQA